MNRADRITTMMTTNRWTIDRTAFELNCTTFDLRWLLNGYPAENIQQQHRLDAIVEALNARDTTITPHPSRLPYSGPGLMRRVPTDKQRGADPYCKNNHLFVRGSYYLTKNGTRRCIECEQARKELRRRTTRAALSALGTLNARGLRDIEIANLIGMSSQTISAYKSGDCAPTPRRIDELQSLVAVTNDLSGQERKGGQMYKPHPQIDEIRVRFESVVSRERQEAA